MTWRRTALGLAPTLAALLIAASGGSAQSAHQILTSASPDRSAAVPLAGRTVSGDAYVHVAPETGVSRVLFYLDDTDRSEPPRQVETRPPWDFAGGSAGSALAFDTTGVPDGEHTVTAKVELAGGAREILHATFTVANAPGPGFDQLHLAWDEDPATTVTAVWHTDGAGTASSVQYRRSGGTAWDEAAGAARPSGAPGTLHEVTLRGLEPATAYEYRVRAPEGWSETFETRTAPPPGPASFDAVYVADTGIAGRPDGLATGTGDVLDAIRALDPLVVLGGGDYASFASDGRYPELDGAIDAWFRQLEPLAARAPFMPTYGDREAGEGLEPWAARFPTPGGRHTYSFDAGDVRFVSVLATEAGVPQEARDWIEADAAVARARGARWIVPYLHLPVMSDGTSHPASALVRAQLGPLFERIGVDVAISSHDQAFERSYPLADVAGARTPSSESLTCYTQADGVTWLKVSPGGKLASGSQGLSAFGSDPPPAWTAARDSTRHHFSRLRFSSAGSLAVETYGVKGDGSAPALQDRFEYTLGSCPHALEATPGSLELEVAPGEAATRTVRVVASDGSRPSVRATAGAPWLTVTPAAASAPADLAVTARAGGLAPGTHRASVQLAAPGYPDANVPVELTVTDEAPAPTHDLMVSPAPARTAATRLEGRTLAGPAYVFSVPEEGIGQVRFWLDDPQASGTPAKVEGYPAFDFKGTNADGSARPLDTTKVADGPHSITAEMDLAGGGTRSVTAHFAVDNAGGPAPELTLDKLARRQGDGAWSQGPVDARAGDRIDYRLELRNPGAAALEPGVTDPLCDAAPAGPGAGDLDSDGWLDPGEEWVYACSHLLSAGDPDPYVNTALATGTAASGESDSATDSVTVRRVTGDCQPVPCLEEVLVDLPYELEFDSDRGKLRDAGGIGTGFTYSLPTAGGAGYLPSRLALDRAAGTLDVSTTKGSFTRLTNTQDNALGVGIDAPNQVTRITTTLRSPPGGSGDYEQAGLWFGNDEDDYVKLVLMSTPDGPEIQFLMEENGVHTQQRSANPVGPLDEVELSLRTRPPDRRIEASYRLNGGDTPVTIGRFTAPPAFFSFDAAGIDPRIGTRSFGGIVTTHRFGPAALDYVFDDFRVVEDPDPAPPPATASSEGIAFDRSSFDVPFPTAMAFGPDGRLYVAELFGTIHALTLDARHRVTDDREIRTLIPGPGDRRLTLGIAFDPLSTPESPILWVAHSSGQTQGGTPNSAMVSRLSGPGLATREDVITGLPRALANHSTNSIHFGPDGRLYVAQGGNTGAGAPNTANTEFGDMQEQPLSAALLVADVHAPAFDGSCASFDDVFGPPPCDVTPFATGLRNMYDFVFHLNGRIYGPDNGLGVEGTFPPSPEPPCFGPGDTRSWTEGGNDPGSRPDSLHLLEQGGYYGHPNPYRDECVFMDGQFQGVAPPPDYRAPIASLGDNRSANGTIEYTSARHCGALRGDLLIANYSVGDDLTRVRLSADGLSVVSMSSLAGGFTDPLPLVQGPDGTVYVGEFGDNRVTALAPAELGCWSARAPLPEELLDAGGAALGGRLYVVGGKTGAGHQSKLRIYDPVADAWSEGPALPGPAVENPAVAVHGGRLHVFGGSTEPFAGAVAKAAAFDPLSGSWTVLPPLPTARGGATAQAIGGRIYVAGGMAADGASVDALEVFDPATGGWSRLAPMGTRRDNPGSAALDGKLHVFGGRTRNAEGNTPEGMLASAEAFDPASGTWTARAPMPTGRRTMAVGVVDGRALVMGGEARNDTEAFPDNEEYDPASDSWRALTPMRTPRHGAAAGTIDGVVHVAGGGPQAGFALSDTVEAYRRTSP